MANDDQFYAQVTDELSGGQIDRVVWTKAFAQSGGAEAATKSLYIRLRVEALREHTASLLQQQRDAAKRYLQGVVTGQNITCPHCGYVGVARREARGNLLVFFVLLAFFVLPGVLYAFATSGFRYRCVKCGSILHERYQIASG